MVDVPRSITITVEPDYPKLEEALDRLRREAFIGEVGGNFNDVVDLHDDVKHMFASGDLSVINLKGENYYRACGELVTGKWGDAATTCVKRIKHPGKVHEDYDGNTTGGSNVIPSTSVQEEAGGDQRDGVQDAPGRGADRPVDGGRDYRDGQQGRKDRHPHPRGGHDGQSG